MTSSFAGEATNEREKEEKTGKRVGKDGIAWRVTGQKKGDETVLGGYSYAGGAFGSPRLSLIELAGARDYRYRYTRSAAVYANRS